MAKFYDEKGNEVEAYTEEELKIKNQEAIDEYIENNPDKSEELNKAKDELEEVNKKIKELEDAGNSDDEQKKRLIQQKKDAEGSLETLKTDLTKQINEIKDGFLSGSKTKILQKLSGDDSELLKKIEFEYDQYNEGKATPSNEIEIQDRLEKAFLLATGNKPTPNFMDNVGNLGNKGNSKSVENIHKEESDNSKAMRKALGISDNDVKEFSPSE